MGDSKTSIKARRRVRAFAGAAGAPARSDGARIHQRIAHDLGVEIVSGRRAPGSLLPKEIDASTRLGVARTGYREAIRILAAKGLVGSRPRTGTRVQPREAWNILDPDVLAWMFESEPSQEFVFGLFELRNVVEPAAAAFAAERRNAAELGRMGHALEEMARFGLEHPAGRIADQAFHEEIFRATRNEALTGLIKTISSAIAWTTVFKQRKRGLARDPIPEHRTLYAAIADGDPEAARAAALDLIRLALEDIKRGMTD